MAANHTFNIGHSATVENEISAKGSSPLLKLSDIDTSNLQHTLSSSAGLVLSADINNVEASSTIDFAVDGSTVGTLGPTGNLTLTSASSPTLSLTDTTNTVTASVYAQDSDVFYGSTTSHATNIGSNNTTAIAIDTSQNVIISGTLGSEKITATVDNNTTALDLQIGDNADYIFTANSTSGYTTTLNMDDTGLDIGHNSAGRSLNLQTAGLDRLTIDGGGAVTIAGNLTVNGTVTSIASTNTTISDALIELGSGNTGANTNDLGLILERGTTGNNGFIGFDESADQFVVATTTGTGGSTGNLTLVDANFRANEITTTHTSNSGGTVRNVYQSTVAPTSGDGKVGDLWITYI